VPRKHPHQPAAPENLVTVTRCMPLAYFQITSTQRELDALLEHLDAMVAQRKRHSGKFTPNSLFVTMDTKCKKRPTAEQKKPPER